MDSHAFAVTPHLSVLNGQNMLNTRTMDTKPNITAQIICDSINPNGSRLTTAILMYPRFIHSELMTHRAFSRNAASSRAIPIAKSIDEVENDPAVFEFWGKNQSGMQSEVEMDESDITIAKQVLRDARSCAVSYAMMLQEASAHKQMANRLLEPFLHITTLVTATDRGWENFFAQRANRNAQPEFQVLAYRMLKEYLGSTIREVGREGWHIPFFEGDEVGLDFKQIKRSVARCARISYQNHLGDMSESDDLALYNRLQSAGHWSPFEHIAQHCDSLEESERSNFDIGRNLSYWYQWRKRFSGECVSLSQDRMCQMLADKPTWFQL